MKRIILFAFALALLSSGCKVFKSSKKGEAAATKTETTAEPKVFSVPAPKSNIRENPVSDTMYETADKAVEGRAVSVRSEKVTFTAQDRASYESKSFYVIVGSFSSNENANRFKQELVQQKFKPIILHSETGYYRVCVDAFDEEAAARSRVQKIRTEFPKYADSWLLIKK